MTLKKDTMDMSHIMLALWFIHTGRIRLRDWYRFHEILLSVCSRSVWTLQFHTTHLLLGLGVGLGLGQCENTITRTVISKLEWQCKTDGTTQYHVATKEIQKITQNCTSRLFFVLGAGGSDVTDSWAQAEGRSHPRLNNRPWQRHSNAQTTWTDNRPQRKSIASNHT